MNGRFVRRAYWVVSISVVMLGMGLSATAQQAHVELCHATGSASNPYVLISPSVAGAFHGHLHHTGPIFDPAEDTSGGGWGDIIPPFQYRGQSYSLNWTGDGPTIFAAGCRVPAQVQPPEVQPGPPITPPEVQPGPPVENQPPFTG